MDTFKNEHIIASKFMEHPDFVEGVSARLIRREDPKWSIASLDEVSDAEVESFFDTSSAAPLELLSMGTGSAYQDYPHAWIGLPREAEVERVVRDGEVTSRKAVVQHFVNAKNGKMGVKEKVEEILTRRTNETQSGLEWF